jgi:hypothetical protein
MGFASFILIRIRIEVKSWIRIRNETNADPQHWFWIARTHRVPSIFRHEPLTDRNSGCYRSYSGELCDAGYVAVASIANTPNPGWKKSGRPDGVQKIFSLSNSRFFWFFFTFSSHQRQTSSLQRCRSGSRIPDPKPIFLIA